MTDILKSTKYPAPNSRTDIEERIRRRAYEIYEHAAELTVWTWTTGSRRKLKLSASGESGRLR